MKRVFSLLLALALLGSLLTAPAFAAGAEKTLTLREDWRLTGNVDLAVPADTTLTIVGNGHYIYEMEGQLLNSGTGKVVFQDTILYPAGESGACNINTSEQLMMDRQPHTVTIASNLVNGQLSAAATAKKGDTVAVTVTPASGYALDTLTVTATEVPSLAVNVSGTSFTMPASDVIVSATFKEATGTGGGDTGGTGSGGGGGGGGSSSTTETVTNTDGSTTTTVTNNATGTITETTKYTDGSTQVVETEKDGTVTTTNTDKDGNKTATVQNPDGTTESTVTRKDGSGSTTAVSADGQVSAKVKLPAAVVEEAVASSQTVALPMASVTASVSPVTAPTVTVELPENIAAQVEIPVSNVTPGTVAVLVKADGTEEVIKTSLTTEQGVAVKLSDGDTVKIVDKTKSFSDVPSGYWGADAVAFVASREIFTGTSDTAFAPETTMSRAMIVTVLARLEGVDTSAGEIWYEAGRNWAVENGISDGTNMEQGLTREQLALMLYRYAGQPVAGGDLSGFADGDSVSSWASYAMAWAVNAGLISGVGGDTLNPQGEATRAQVAAIFQRFIQQSAF